MQGLATYRNAVHSRAYGRMMTVCKREGLPQDAPPIIAYMFWDTSFEYGRLLNIPTT